MAQLSRIALATAAAAWALLAVATVWNARQNEALRQEVAQLRRQLAAATPPQVPATPAPAAAVPAPAAAPDPAPGPVAAPKPPAPAAAPVPQGAPVTLEQALARWREAPARAAANPFASP